jgi:hypothetical protein
MWKHRIQAFGVQTRSKFSVGLCQSIAELLHPNFTTILICQFRKLPDESFEQPECIRFSVG